MTHNSQSITESTQEPAAVPRDVFSRIVVVVGDITAQPYVDVIVNAANENLLGGGGVDGAIHRAAGPELLEACRVLGGCPAGGVRLTPAFNLKAKFVAHAVGPRWRGGNGGFEAHQLATCYATALFLAKTNGARSVAFPAISTGAFGYPLDQATTIAVRTVADYLAGNSDIEVRFVCFDEATADVYRLQISALAAAGKVSL